VPPLHALVRQVVRIDVALFDRVARSRGRVLDHVLPRLTRAANHSRIWLAAAALLAALGGRRGKRAAIRGVGSISVTSLVVNQVVKRLVRRPRPALRHVPVARRLDAQPLTTSFPSGHAASAAAFAVGVASEYSRAGVPLGALAATVGYSRTYVGVHYPLDVAVGGALGAGFGLLTRLVWPVLPDEVEDEPPTREAVALPPSPDGDGVALVVNRDAGSPLGGPDAEELRRRLPRARIVVVDDPAELPDALGEAAGDCRTLGISGGDGSIATAAAVALERDKPLLVIPAGTLNHLGRDLRVESADDALAALASGHGLRIDVGLIDGRPFVNTASFGGYTTMLEVRESLQKRIGRWPAHLAAVAIAALRAEPLELELDGRRRRAWMVFAGNCRHEPSGFAPSWRPRLDDGLLDVRILSGEAPLARLRLLASVLTGRLTRSVAYEQRCVARLGVRTSSDSLTLARDGDSFEGSGSFELRKLPRGLAVYAPTDAR
jgi:diacylglycerol kinase family enzyme/membrane-associated phospholipid phosphatase